MQYYNLIYTPYSLFNFYTNNTLYTKLSFLLIHDQIQGYTVHLVVRFLLSDSLSLCFMAVILTFITRLSWCLLGFLIIKFVFPFLINDYFMEIYFEI